MELNFPSLPLLFTFLLFLFVLVKKAWSNPVSKLPPGPWKLPLIGRKLPLIGRKLPLIGSMHHLLGSLPHRCLRDLAKKHGPLMHLRLGEVSTVVVSSPKVAAEVMKTHDILFAYRPATNGSKILSYGLTDVAFAPYGDYWKQVRKICVMELFTAKRVQSLGSVIEEEVTVLIQSISQTIGSPVNLTQKLLTLTNNVICRVAFGGKCQDRQGLIEVMKESLQLLVGFSVDDFFPSFYLIHVISGMKFRLEKLHQKMDKILDDIIEEHKKKKGEIKGESEEDLVDVLLKLQEHGDLEFSLTTNNIKAIIWNMFTAGGDTSSETTVWAMAELMKTPRVMEKAQAEVRQVYKEKDRMEDSATLELHYIKLVIKETLRLHPPAPLIPRECRERCEIDGYEIPAKSKVVINAWAIGRDSEHWDDPETFMPERFEKNLIDFKGGNFEYLPFGAGRRICPGLLLGVANIEHALAQLLFYFDWKLPDGIVPKNFDMAESFGLTLARKTDLCLIAVPRIPVPTV